MAKNIKVKVLIDFKDKENQNLYKRNDIVIFSEKRAEELLKNTYLIEKIEDITIEENKTKIDK